MASGKYQFLSQSLLNYLFNGAAFPQPGSLYLALFSVTPTISTLGTECAGAGYARVAIVSNTTNWPTISGAVTTITNGATFTFPTATGNWAGSANLTGAGFFDALSAGHLLYSGDLSQAKPCLSGDTCSMAAGAVTVQEQ